MLSWICRPPVPRSLSPLSRQRRLAQRGGWKRQGQAINEGLIEPMLEASVSSPKAILGQLRSVVSASACIRKETELTSTARLP